MVQIAKGMCAFGIGSCQRTALARTAQQQQQQWPQQQQQQLKWHLQQQGRMLQYLQRRRVWVSTDDLLRLPQEHRIPAGISCRGSSMGHCRSNSSRWCCCFCKPSCCNAGFLEVIPSVTVRSCLLQKVLTNSAAATFQSSSSTNCCCGHCNSGARNWGCHQLDLSTKQRGVSHVAQILVQQRQQHQKEQQEEGNSWWEDADIESQSDFSGAAAAHAEASRDPMQQQQAHEQSQKEQEHSVNNFESEELRVSSPAATAYAVTAAAAASSSTHSDIDPVRIAPFKTAVPTAGTESAGLSATDVSLFLMATPLTPAERHELVCLWRRVSSMDSLLKPTRGISEGPSLAALLEARWGLPVSLLSAAQTQRAFLRWLYTALQQHQGQQYLRAHQQSQQQSQQEQQDCQQQPQPPQQTSCLDTLQAEAFNDLLQSIRGQFDLQEAAAIRKAQQQQPHERLQALLQQWKGAAPRLEEGDLLCSTYGLLLEIYAAAARPQRALREAPGAVKDPIASPVIPPAVGPLLALYRVYLARTGISATVSYKNILKLVDLRAPELWFPIARQQKRQVHLSLGPPNSGKTRGALEALLGAPSGCYLGPLRLLATEVYNELRKRGIKCSLITGPSKIIDPKATHVCSTVEAAPLDKDFSVGVIDEVQLLADPQRGPAWTRAFLGLRVKELHVCGEEGAGPLVESLLLQCGDTIRSRYKRTSLAGIKVEEEPLPTDWVAALQPGDCLLAFSANACWRLKGLLSASGVQAALLYGQLPPEVRLKQAKRFNEAVEMHARQRQQQKKQDQHGQQHLQSVCAAEAPPTCTERAPASPVSAVSKTAAGGPGLGDTVAAVPLPPHSVLIATDAIGLGVNLSIRRIIFTSISKFDGISLRRLSASEARQLAYRAGRFGGPWGTQGGVVSALQQDQLGTLRTLLEGFTVCDLGPGVCAPPLKAAALLPESWAFELFVHFAADTTPVCTAALIQKFVSLLHTRSPYFIPGGALHRAVAVAALLRDVPLPLRELYIFCMAPVTVSRLSQMHRTEQQREIEEGVDLGAETAFPRRTTNGRISDNDTEAATVGGTPDAEATVAAAAASISLPIQAALRSFAVSLAATRVVPLPPPFRVVRKTDRKQQEEQQLERMGLWSVDEGLSSSYAAPGVGYFDIGAIGALSDTKETEAAPAETMEALRAWETIYQVLDLYLWLAEKLPTPFVDVPLALTGRSLAADVIMKALQRETPLQSLGALDGIGAFHGSREDSNAVGGCWPQRISETQQRP